MIRPADANEVAEAWRVAIDRRHQPVASILTRQDVPSSTAPSYASAEGVRRGGYVLADSAEGAPEVILIATGSEVALALAAHEELSAEGIRSRSSACPAGSSSTARTRPTATRCCRPRSAPGSSVEEASTLGWDRWVGPEGEWWVCIPSAARRR